MFLKEAETRATQSKKNLVAKVACETGIGYEVPHALTAAICLLMRHVSTGERLFSDSPKTFNALSRKDSFSQTLVGDFSSSGLNVTNGGLPNEMFGVAALAPLGILFSLVSVTIAQSIERSTMNS